MNEIKSFEELKEELGTDYDKKLYEMGVSAMREITRLNNIINELEKEFEWQLKKQIDIDKFAEEQGFLNYNPVKLMVEHFKDKLKELKEGKNDNLLFN